MTGRAARRKQPSLADMLTLDTIALRVTVADWEGAVRAAGGLLVASGAAEPRYVDAMIAMVREIGPYIVIAPGVALPHARPEEGVRRPCMSLLTLATAVNFGNAYNDPVSLVIAFGTPDKEGHIAALAQLARLLENAPALEKIREAATAEEIVALVRKHGRKRV
jgi:mannitol/fructose-specific phosphotransferase system IIA component (Ntr-type)